MRIANLWIGKIIYTSLRLTGRRGAALPGLVVEHISPKFIRQSLAQITDGVIVITGTNGKTTSTRMLVSILTPDKRVLTNPTGSNFLRGVASSIIQKSSWFGNLPYDIAVFELDEAYAAQFAKVFQPRATVVLNVMRDQMDRFGEIDHTAKLIEKVVKKSTDFVILNRDDPRVAKMARGNRLRSYYFGVSDELRKMYPNDDELHSQVALPTDGTRQSAIAELVALDLDGQIKILLDGQPYVLNLTNHGTHNAQNAIAICAAAMALGMPADRIVERLAKVRPAFGRGEIIAVGSKTVILQLVKNPGGFRHALQSNKQLKYNTVMIAINDDYADSRDVSWLWDVSFAAGKLSGPILTSGTRAIDMALRLKYDDLAVDTIEPDLMICLQKALDNTINDGIILIYTTYTAMLAIRRLLSKLTKVEPI